jgi:hypothetical protein
MSPEDSVPAGGDPDDTQRPDIRNEIGRLRAGARERELKAEQESVTAQETRPGLPEAGSRQEPESTGEPAHVPAPDEQARRRALAAEIAEREELVSDQEYVARARRARDEAVARFGLDPDQADAGYLADLEAESYPDRAEAWMEANDPDRERAIAAVRADEAARADDRLHRELTHALAAVARHGTTGAANPRSRAHADAFADIWGAFARLRESLGLPEASDGAAIAADPEGQIPPVPVSAALLEDAMAGARASAAWYRDTPEWQRITLVTSAARALLDAIRSAAGSYWNEISQDIRVRGFIRAVAARTSRTVSACAGALAGKLEQTAGRQTHAWRAMSLLHRTAGAAANRIIGYRPPVADAEQIIDGLSRQRPASARPPQAASPVALAALSFPGPVSQATTAESAPGRRRNAATGTHIRRPGGLLH